MGCSNLIQLLKREVVPALGCTEPIAVAYAVAKAKKILNTDPDRIEVLLSRNMIKNGMGVGIPGTGMTGLGIAAALGAVGGDPDAGLEVLCGVKSEHIDLAKKMLNDNKVFISLKNVPDKLYIEVICYNSDENSKIIIKDKHTNIVLIEQNGNKLYEKKEDDATVAAESDEDEILLSIDNIYDFAMKTKFIDLKFLLDGVNMNMKVSEEGMNRKYGLGVGKALKESVSQGIMSDDLAAYASIVTASAADARMSGCTYPVMSSAGSGNQGLTAILPVAAIARRLKKDDEVLVRALAISHLVTIHVKSYIGRLSALCGCGVAASIGACSAITYLLGGDKAKIKSAVKNMIGDVSGMICDGAKAGCALKLATAVNAAVQCASLAVSGVEISSNDGIIDKDVETTIRNLGNLCTFGMVDTDRIILDIMSNKQ